VVDSIALAHSFGNMPRTMVVRRKVAVLFLAMFLSLPPTRAFISLKSNSFICSSGTRSSLNTRTGDSVVRRSSMCQKSDACLRQSHVGRCEPDVSPITVLYPQVSRIRKRRQIVSVLATLEDFESEVLAENERMVVVRFQAPWCKTCKAIEVAYNRLAEANPEIKFVDVVLTDKNIDLRNTVNVWAVPFGHVYHPDAGLVEANPLDRRRFSIFKRVLASYRFGECAVPEEGAVKNPFEG